MKIFVLGLIVAASVAAGVTTASGGVAASRTHRIHGIVPHHAHHARHHKTPKKTAGFKCGSSCSSYMAAINKFFADVAADSGKTTNVYALNNEYCQGVPTGPDPNWVSTCNGGGTPIAYDSTFGGSFVVDKPYPANGCSDTVTMHGKNYRDKVCLTDAQLQAQIESVITANGLPTDSTRLYSIFTPANVGVCIYPGAASDANPCTTNAFCAYHSNTASNIIYSVQPDDLMVPNGGCDTMQTPVGSGADATISTLSHEHNEAITDPFGDGWWAEDGNENGDLCAYNFGEFLGTAPNGYSYNQLINGTPYFLQQEYSNAVDGCLQRPGGTVSPVTLGDGSGPLLYRGGSVMVTNTAYAIYWIPASPANTVRPNVSGTAKVGKKLTASLGTWSYAPKNYEYRWLRCAPGGGSCKSITGANHAAYTLVAADAKHPIKVRVTATNAAGTTNANSAPTAAVKT